MVEDGNGLPAPTLGAPLSGGAPAPGTGESQPRAGRTVILVEDDADMADILRKRLANFGFTVVVLTRPGDPEAALDPGQPAAVIMDIVFDDAPDGGLEAVRGLRDTGILACPVVFLTVRDDFDARLKAVRAGCDSYMVKPLDVVELADTLERLVTRNAVNPYRALIVEDDPETAALYQQILNGAGIMSKVVTDPTAVLRPLGKFHPDVILLDINMPGCNGIEVAVLIRQLKGRYLNLPIVFVTGSGEEDKRLLAVRSGGDDLLTKPVDPEFLVSSVTARAGRSRAVAQVAARQESSERRFRAFAESASEAVISCNADGVVVFWSPGAKAVFGFGPEETLGRKLPMIMPPRLRQAQWQPFAALRTPAAGSPAPPPLYEMTGLHKDGREFPIEVPIGAVPGGGTVQFTAIMRDVSERVANRARLAESERRLDLSQEFANIGTWDWNIQTGQVFWSSRVGPLLGYDDPEIGHSYDNFLAAIHAEERGARAKVLYIEDNPANLALMEMIVTRVKGGRPVVRPQRRTGPGIGRGSGPGLDRHGHQPARHERYPGHVPVDQESQDGQHPGCRA